MQCQEFEQVFEQQEAAPLPADAAAHLGACGQCRAMVSDLEAIQAAARGMAAAQVEPPERLWVSLRAQLVSEGLIREPAEAVHTASWLSGWLAGLPRPALAGAYLAFVLAAAGLIALQSNLRRVEMSRSTPAPATTAALDSQLTTVERRTILAMRQNNPVVTDSLRKNLDIVDNFIAMCEKSVREEPENDVAREYLYGAYQQKAELLAMMVERGALGD
ncbi:MAG: hypothetical protein WAR21_08315 [Candidatus Acidiferrales bacterium]